MRSMTRGFTLLELLITLAIVGILASVAVPFFNRSREERAGSPIRPTFPVVVSPQKSSPYSPGGELICEGVYDHTERECRNDDVCPTYIHFVGTRVRVDAPGYPPCVVHDAHPLNITVPRGTHIRITLHRVDTYRIEPLPAEKP